MLEHVILPHEHTHGGHECSHGHGHDDHHEHGHDDHCCEGHDHGHHDHQAPSEHGHGHGAAPPKAALSHGHGHGKDHDSIDMSDVTEEDHAPLLGSSGTPSSEAKTNVCDQIHAVLSMGVR